MPDPADERAAYREALARAEEAGVWIGADGETPAIPEDAVPVVASDVPADPEPVETPAEVVAEETPAEPEVLTEAQLREQILALESRLADKDTFIGRQSSEVGELREAINELSQRFDTPPQQIQVQPQQQITQDYIDNDPAGATLAAWERVKDNPNVSPKEQRDLERAFEAWKEYEPFNAASWRADELRQQESNALRAELEATRSQIQKIATSNDEVAQKNEVNKQWRDAYTAVEAERPGFIENAERLLNEVAPQFPDAIEALATGGANAKAEILKLLYDHDRAVNTNPETVRQQLEEAAAEATAEAQATRQAAAGVVGQTTSGQGTQEKSWEEEEQARYAQRRAGEVSLDRGWQGRPTERTRLNK